MKSSRLKNFYEDLKQEGYNFLEMPTGDISDALDLAVDKVVNSWNNNADHSYFSEDLIKIHHTSFDNNFKELMKIGGDYHGGSISASFYEDGEIDVSDFYSSGFGLLIEGNVYYASNSENCVFSGLGEYGHYKYPFSHRIFPSGNKENPLEVTLDRETNTGRKFAFRNECLIEGFAIWGVFINENQTWGEDAKLKIAKYIERNNFSLYTSVGGKLTQIHYSELF